MSDSRKDVKPFVKWAGGKRGLIDKFEEGGYFPKQFNNYFEPFLGGGAVFFHICKNYNPEQCILSDVNSDLIETYRVIKSKVEDLIQILSSVKKEYEDAQDQEKFYYGIRDEFNELKLGDNSNKVRKTALFIFLNKTCYNGLYRVNKKGEFNVPFGRYKNPSIFNVTNLRNVSELLEADELLNEDFEKAVEGAEKGDFIYFDPPYAPLTKTADFTSYTKEDFGLDEQRRLAEVLNELAEKGCYVMESNSSSEIITKDIYKDYDNLKIYFIEAPRYISCKSDGRKPVKEVVITNYQPDPKQKKLTLYK